MENQTGNVSSTISPVVSDTCRLLSIFQSFGLPLFALAAILIISLLEKRRYKADICFGRPGLPLPINFLDGTSNSVANAAAVGCTMQYIVYYLFYHTSNVTFWLKSLLLLFISILVSVVFYPIFACLNSSSRMLGSAVGFLYTLLLTLLMFALNLVCTTAELEWVLAIYSIMFISELYLLGLFAYRFITAVSKKSKNEKESMVKTDQRNHVRDLLSRPKTILGEKEIHVRQRIVEQSRRVLEEAKLCCLHKNLYRFTTRTLVINTAVFLVFYFNFVLIINSADLIDTVNDKLKSYKYIANLSGSLRSQLLKQFHIFLVVLRVSLILSNILSGVYVVANMILIYRSQRQQLFQLWRGERSFIPPNCKQTHNDLLVKNLMYTGNQVSFLVGGYIFSQFVIVFLCFGIAYFIILPLKKDVPDVFLYPVKIIIPPVVFMLLFTFILRLISGKFFLQNHYLISADGESEEKALALDNRRVYQNLSYFLFFYYILVGFFRCVYRVGISSALVLFHIARLDKPLVFPGFERFDIGYMTYLGFLEVELHHCHPVVLVSCDLMLKTAARKLISSQQQQLSLESIVIENNKMDFSNTYTRKIRNRWLKTKTLISNGSLCEHSKTNTSFHNRAL
uniref:Stimulated by retinoic acid gene 6 protein-like isoform X1 n=2 Tax=Crassostrea virginica TaxID=6565 RepID=A0A8B8EA80_CRAVI|nr:stimulated by retinoic acid gene 6 protein-like isoform X1 [Crassostrea virginica]XP_022336396.1 stimulated by retinoic acid gene 6 protein-like isoform X1 [Crassostrea virginica]